MVIGGRGTSRKLIFGRLPPTEVSRFLVYRLHTPTSSSRSVIERGA